MAEAFGVVSLSIQLAESLHKVKGFYESVKNALSQVAELIEEIEIMNDILGDLETGSQSTNVASTPTMRRCMKVAHGATKRFAVFSVELQTRIRKSKYRGSIKFALNRDDIKQMLNQPERTKSSLNLAYSLYQQATAEDRHAALIQAVSSSHGIAVPLVQTAKVSLPAQDITILTHGGKQVSQHKLQHDLSIGVQAFNHETECLHVILHGYTPFACFLKTIPVNFRWRGIESLLWRGDGSGVVNLRPRTSRRALKMWLNILQRAGVDLIAYGADESRRLQAHRVQEKPLPPSQLWDWSGMSFDEVYYFEFSYGPAPDDWTVQLDMTEQYAGDFWRMPGLLGGTKVQAIPGSWIDT